jgi:NADH-quinone oxidoreductase subunit N
MVGLAIVVVSLIGVGQQLVYNNTYGYLWLLANVIGIVYILASKDWLITIAAGEVFNLSLYLLAGVIGLQYFLLSALATTLLILGCVIIYAFSGTLHYEGIIIIIAFVNVTLHYGSAINLLIVAMLLKLGVAPIHNWAPDLYSSLYLPVTFWFALLPKLAILGVLLQIPITLAPLMVSVSTFMN